MGVVAPGEKKNVHKSQHIFQFIINM